MKKAFVTCIAVFLCAVFVYLALWNYIADGRLHGADAINVVSARLSQSYSLNLQNIVAPEKFLARLADARDPAGRFVSGLLTQQGKGALQRLVQSEATNTDRQLVEFELNNRVIDAEVQWPADLLGVNRQTFGTDLSGRQQYNMQIMGGLFKNHVQYNKHIPFRKQMAHDINLQSFFALTSPTRYAPLTALYTTIMTIFILDNPGNLRWAALIVACLYGLQVLFVYLLAFEALKSFRWALLCTFLFMMSFPALLATYSLFALPYYFIPMAMCAAGFFYLKYRNMEHGGGIYLLLYCLAAFVGPWFREAALVMPFIVFATELLTYRGRRSLAAMILSLALMVHGFYPSLLTWLLGINTGNYYSLLEAGNIKAQMGGSLNWTAPGTVFVQIPPLLWLGALVAAAICTWRCPFVLWAVADNRLTRWLNRVLMGLWGKFRIQTALHRGLALLLVLAGCVVAVTFFGDFRNPGAPLKWSGFAVFALLSVFALCSFRHSVFFPVFFMAVLLPFMRINGNTEIHTCFILPPLIIMIVLWLRELCRMRSRVKKPVAALITAMLLVGAADQGMNLYACVSSQRAAIATNREMGLWFATHTPLHSIVVGNFFNMADVFYYSGYHIDPFESVENCPMGPAKVVHKDEDMRMLLAGNAGIRPVYIASADLERYEYQKGYHSHKYVLSPPGELQELAHFKTLNRYWYLDPLKYFIPRWFVSIPVYMDWSIDFYYNNEKIPFRRILKADYVVYRLNNANPDLLLKRSGRPVIASHPGIMASSVMDKNNPDMNPAGLLAGTGIWHAQSPPKYPEWVEIEYPEPFLATGLSVLPQPEGPAGKEHLRAPKDFLLQGSNDRKTWSELLSVRGNVHANGSEWRQWTLRNSTPWRYYRLFITASGDPALLTIRQIRLEAAKD